MMLLDPGAQTVSSSLSLPLSTSWNVPSYTQASITGRPFNSSKCTKFFKVALLAERDLLFLSSKKKKLKISLAVLTYLTLIKDQSRDMFSGKMGGWRKIKEKIFLV